MRTRRTLVAGLMTLGLVGQAALAEEAPEARIGEPAPIFEAMDTQGTLRKLEEFRGKLVVIEWFNPQCPFVKKHYDSGNMQRLQEQYTGRDVVWLSVNSSAPGKQGHVTPEQANAWAAEQKTHATAMLLDPAGAIGRRYGAMTTPHVFVLDPNGVLRYQGAIDDTASTDQADIPQSKNYVAQALDALLAEQPVEVSSTQPYGCSVKY